MFKYILVAVISITTISCKEKVKATDAEAAQFYNTIQQSFGASYEPEHLFMEQASDAVAKVKADNNVVIDTKEIKAILFEAKKSSIDRMRIVQSVKEVDESIGYKTAVAKSIDLFSKACDKEFKDFVELLDMKVDNKLDKLTQIVQQKLYEIETAAKDAEAAKNELIAKYKIKS